MKDFIRKKVEEFAEFETYQGFTAVVKTFSEKFKIKLLRNPVDREKIKFAIGIRNLLVHNNGKANKRFIKRWKEYIGKELKIKNHHEGTKISLNNDYIFSVFPLLKKSVCHVDNEAIRKFFVGSGLLT